MTSPPDLIVPVIYIAGPYNRNASRLQIGQHIDVARKQAEAVAKRGAFPVCPHLVTAPMAEGIPEAQIMIGLLRLLETCDAIYLCPGWETSAGTAEELRMARAYGLQVLKTSKDLDDFLVEFALMEHSAEASEMPAASDPRSSILREAEQLTTMNRNKDYAEPEDNFLRIANLWNAHGWNRGIIPQGVHAFLPYDVALMSSHIKDARIAESPFKRDHWADRAGYTACGWQCVVRSQEGA